MIAQTIVQQLGQVCLTLLGAHTLMEIEEGAGLQFLFQGSDRSNMIQIILDPCDTYTVRFWNIKTEKRNPRGVPYTEMSCQLVVSHSDIYCDMLHDLIEEVTGLCTLEERHGSEVVESVKNGESSAE